MRFPSAVVQECSPGASVSSVTDVGSFAVFAGSAPGGGSLQAPSALISKMASAGFAAVANLGFIFFFLLDCAPGYFSIRRALNQASLLPKGRGTAGTPKARRLRLSVQRTSFGMGPNGEAFAIWTRGGEVRVNRFE